MHLAFLSCPSTEVGAGKLPFTWNRVCHHKSPRLLSMNVCSNRDMVLCLAGIGKHDRGGQIGTWLEHNECQSGESLLTSVGSSLIPPPSNQGLPEHHPRAADCRVPQKSAGISPDQRHVPCPEPRVKTVLLKHQKHGLRDSVQATGALGALLWVCGPRTAATRLAVYRPEVQPQQSGSRFSPRCPDRRDYTSRRECKFVGDV